MKRKLLLLTDVAKAALKEKFMTVSSYIKKKDIN